MGLRMEPSKKFIASFGPFRPALLHDIAALRPQFAYISQWFQGQRTFTSIKCSCRLAEKTLFDRPARVTFSQVPAFGPTRVSAAERDPASGPPCWPLCHWADPDAWPRLLRWDARTAPQSEIPISVSPATGCASVRAIEVAAQVEEVGFHVHLLEPKHFLPDRSDALLHLRLRGHEVLRLRRLRLVGLHDLRRTGGQEVLQFADALFEKQQHQFQ